MPFQAHTSPDRALAQERLWHLSLFIARGALGAFIVGYLYLMGGVAQGGLGLTSILGVLGAYAVATLTVAVLSKGRELSPALRRTQTVLDNLALAIGVPHDPSAAMPVAFYLAISPLEFGVRYGVESYRYAVLTALAATAAILCIRMFLIDTGLDVEAAGLLLFTWSAILYGLLTVNGMERLRTTVDDLHQRHQTAMRAVHFATWMWQRNGKPSQINPEIDALFGLAPGTYDGGMQTFLSYIHPDDRAAAGLALQRSADAGTGFEIRFRRQKDDGSIRWLASRGEPETVARDGQVTRMAGVIWDVTDEMRAREQAEKTLNRVESAVQIGSIAFWEIDAVAKTIEYDSSGQRERGMSQKAMPLEMLAGLVHPDDRRRVEQAIEKILGNEKIVTLSFRWYQQRTSQYVHMHCYGNVIRNADGKVTGVAGVAVDETERVQAQQRIEIALARVDAAAAASRIGFWRIDKATGKLDLDHNWCEVLGFDPDAPLPTLEESLAWVHPDDRELFHQKTQHALINDEPLIHEYRVHRADTGELRHFQIRGDVVRDADGQVLNRAGFIMDQTETVLLRNEARRATTLLETSLDVLPAVAFRVHAGKRSVELVGNIMAMSGLELEPDPMPLEAAFGLIYKPDRAEFAAALNHALDTGGKLEKTYRVVNAKTGKHHWHVIRGQAIKDAQGAITAVIGVIVDETHTEQQRQQLEALRERYDRGMRAAGVGGWTWFADNDQFDAEPLLLELFGVGQGPNQRTAKAWMDQIHPDDRKMVEDQLRSSLIAGEGFEVRYRRQSAQDQTHWTMTRGEPVAKDAKGHVRRMAGATWDITELATLTEALERSNRELDDFAHIASHDLREPLRGLHNYSKFLNEDYADKIDDEGRRMLSSLSRLSQRLEGLISDLLHFSRVGRTELAIESTDLNVVVKDVIETLEYSIADQQIDIRIPEVLPTLKCDRVRVGELYRNLITNAIKYNDKDDKWIELGCNDGVFYVRDNGIGIAPEHHDRVFAIFKRLHTRDAFGGGTGAGLTIVKRIVERHNGKIWLESEHGEGTTFYFTLSERSSTAEERQSA